MATTTIKIEPHERFTIRGDKLLISGLDETVKIQLPGGDEGNIILHDLLEQIENRLLEAGYLGGILLTHAQLEAWAGRTLTTDDLARLDVAIPNSSIPEAIGVIVDSLTED